MKVLAGLVILISIFVYQYLDGRIPEPIPEQYKVKVIDAWMKTYGHVFQRTNTHWLANEYSPGVIRADKSNFLVQLGVTEPFSDLDRKIADWFILVMTTGNPLGLGYDPKLQITDMHMKGIRVKMYQPVATLGKTNRPILVYFHGGGWSTLSVDSYDPLMRKLAKDSGVVIVSVNYRLSPQHPYPAPLHDCLDVVEYVIENAESLGVDKNRIGIGGDSAGGNMAASIALRLKKKVALQMLLVPVLQIANWNTTSAIENSLYLSKSINSPGSLYFVLNYLQVPYKYIEDFRTNNHTSAEFKVSQYAEYIDQNTWLPRRYVRDERLRENINLPVGYGNEELFSLIKSKLTDPMVAPLMADDDMFDGLSPAYIMTCGYDFIRDDGIMYYERLHQIGQEATLSHYSEGFHNSLFFPHGPLKLDVGVRIVQDIVNVMKDKLVRRS